MSIMDDDTDSELKENSLNYGPHDLWPWICNNFISQILAAKLTLACKYKYSNCVVFTQLHEAVYTFIHSKVKLVPGGH